MVSSNQFPAFTELESLVVGFTEDLLATDIAEVPKKIDGMLQALLKFSLVDRFCMIRLSGDNKLESAFIAAKSGIPKPRVISPDPDSLYLKTILNGKMIILDTSPESITSPIEFDSLNMQGMKAHLVIPLHIQGKIWGAITAARFDNHDIWDPGLITRIHAVGRYLAAIYERYLYWQKTEQQKDKLASLSHHLMESQEAERRELSRELHDNFSQRMAMLSLNAGTIVKEINNGGSTLESANELHQQIQKLAKDMQALSRSLHPSILKDLGLEAGIKSECRRIEGLRDIEVLCVIDPLPTIDMTVSLNLYRILQESLNNVLKHAKNVSLVFVSLTFKEYELELTVRDDGEGFVGDLDDVKGSLGIVSMQERALLLSGKAYFDSPDEGGFEVRVAVPYNSLGE